MKKTFEMENDVGIKVTYTILGVSGNESSKYAVYTNYFPSDNELGVRLFAGRLASENPIVIDKLSNYEQNELIEAFKVEMINSGQRIKRVISK